MQRDIIVALINNATLLLVLSVIYEVTYLLPERYRRIRPVLHGVLIGLVCIAIMTIPFTLQPGLFYDTRSILISSTALIFGPVPTVLASAIAAAFRIVIGGAGTLPGLAVILTSALIGLAWRRWLYPQKARTRWLNIYAMGLTVHITMLVCMLLLPFPNNFSVIKAIAMPVLLIYPLISILLGLLLMKLQEMKQMQELLMQSEERFQMLFNKAPLGYQSLDRSGCFLNVNQQWLDTLGYTREEVIGKWFGVFLAPEYREVFRKNFEDFIAKGCAYSEYEMLHKSGAKLFFSFEGKIAFNLEGKFEQTHCILKDITEQKKNKEALMNSEIRYRRLFEAAADGIMIMDAETGTVLDVNPVLIDLAGAAKEKWIGKPIWEIDFFKDLIGTAGQVKELMENGCLRNGNQVLRSARGRTVFFEIVGSVYHVKNQKVMQCNFRDITDRKKAEAELLYLSSHDSLTGLYNRRYFESALERCNREKEFPLSIITGDINGLKLINEAFGEDAGDLILVETAKLLHRCCREGDVPTRTGGDEFHILLPKTDRVTALKILQEIKNECDIYNRMIYNEAFHINLSLGAGTRETAREDFSQVVKMAESNMYQSKLLDKKSFHSAILSSIKATMMEKSHETEAHAERLVELSGQIARSLCLSQNDMDHLSLLATLHDIGKVGIPDQILNKPDQLTDEEWVEMKKHPEIGYRIASSSPELSSIADYILCHHERWDGNGYPQNLAGNEIPLLSRIIAVVDAYDAMTQDRPYRKAMSGEAAIDELLRNSGSQFDPTVVELFVEADH